MLTPQQLLTKIHETGIFTENWGDFPTKKSRTEKIRLYREQLRQINRQLKEAEDTIKATFDGRNQTQAILERLNLLPYSLIRDLIENVGIGLKKIEIDESLSLPQYGEVIYGDLEEGYWAIGDEITAQKWNIQHTAKKHKSNITQSEIIIKQNEKILKSYTDVLIAIFIFGAIIGTIFLFPMWIYEENPLTLYSLIGLATFSAILVLLGWFNKRKNAKIRIEKATDVINSSKESLIELKKLYQSLSRGI